MTLAIIIAIVAVLAAVWGLGYLSGAAVDTLRPKFTRYSDSTDIFPRKDATS